jgi:hypothetical protein
MNDFNAHQARKIANSTYTDELNDILVKIKDAAEYGETGLIIREHIGDKTIQSLREREFSVEISPSWAFQRGEGYYTIGW